MEVFDTRHVVAPVAGKITEILPPLLTLSTERVSELLNLGSVYLNKKRILDDQVIPSMSYLRVHCKPKRYPVEAVDWKSLVIFENDDFIVINKPQGFPVPSAVDNVRETVFAQVQKALNAKFYITQRLDVPTQGLIVFAKTVTYQKLFNHLLAERGTHKEYLARTSAPPPLGLHVHYLKPALGAPREVFAIGEENWKECLLNVLSVEPEPQGTYLVRIHLMTGRTHQIRAQMKALQCPLWGDTIYDAPGPESEFLLLSQLLRFTCPISQKKMEFNIQQW